MLSSQDPSIKVALDAKLISLVEPYLVKGDLVIDSRKLNSGDVFCAYAGDVNDGRDYIEQAISNNISLLLWDDKNISLDALNQIKSVDIAQVAVPHLRNLVGIFAANKYNYPSRSMTTIAVTGTNGKTSVSSWLAQMYDMLGYKSSVIGTNGYGIYPKLTEINATTPDPVKIQQLLSAFNSNGANMCAMEVSSHGLEQGRVNGVEFTTAVFTNLTLDHLDYHKSMANYYLSKKKLFYWTSLKHAIINQDDQYGVQLISELKLTRPNLNILSYGINSGEIRATDIKTLAYGMSFNLVYLGVKYLAEISIIGLFNIYNILAVIASLIVEGYSITQILTLLAKLKPIPGRMQLISKSNYPLIVVDFAHTPDALTNVLNTIRQTHPLSKICCVFGCGGDRDKSKRAFMGQISTSLADLVIITTDNPRYEDPLAIANDICSGLDKTNYRVILDRKLAIESAIKSVSVKDIVLIAGKGHENYQIIADKKYFFSDVLQVENILKIRINK